MKPPAVTEDTSAVFSSSSIEDALESGFLPDDPTYRKTGKFADDSDADTRKASAAFTTEKEEKDEKDEQDEKDTASSGAQDGESAAASQAAEPQEEDSTEKKPQIKRGGESRWAKLSRENKELREWKARHDTQQPQPARESQQASPPAADAAKSAAAPRPKIDDVDAKTGQPKYSTYADYENARDEWNQNEAIRKFQDTSAKSERERAQQQAKETIAREWGKRTEAASKKYADFAEVALNVDLPIKEGSPVDLFVLDSDAGPDVLYFLGQNPEELERINGLHPLKQVRELTKIELELASSSGNSGKSQTSSSAKPVTKAPPPPHQVSGKGTVGKDAIEDAVEHSDTETYIREANARDPRLAALRKRK